MFRGSKTQPEEEVPEPRPSITPRKSDAAKNVKNAPQPPEVVQPPANRVNNAGLYLATFYSNIGSFFFGIAMGWSSGAKRAVMRGSSYRLKPSEGEWDFIFILLSLGAVVWCLPMGLLLRAWGCRRTILVQLLPNALGWILTAWAQSIPMLYAGRFILGMCGGAHCVAVPIYSAEISSVMKRGIMGVCFHGACLVGVIFSFVMCSLVELRNVNFINLVLILLGLLQILMPESPMYYVNRGKIERAEDTLRKLRGKNYDTRKEMAALTREPSESEHEQHHHPLQGFKYKKARRSLARSVVLLVLQALGGTYIFIFNCLDLVSCQNLRFEMTGVLAVATLLGFLLCFFLVERMGRRLLIIVFSAVTFFASITVGFGLKLFQDNGGDILPWIILFAKALFVGAQSAGLGTISWLLAVEMYVAPMRPLGYAISVTIGWLTASVIIFWYSVHDSICQPYIFLFCAVIAVLSLLFAVVYIPETKGLSVNKIQQRMGGIVSRPTVTTFTSSDDSA